MLPELKLPFPVSKSSAAFLLSAQRMFHLGPVYYWTLTFKRQTFNRLKAMDRYHRFMSNGLLREFPLAYGLRVVELQGSGSYHFHFLISQYVHKTVLDGIASRWSFGYTWVRQGDFGTAHYLAKYLTKGDSRLPRGVRVWASFGPWSACLVKDIVVQSVGTRNMRLLYGSNAQVGYQIAEFLFVVSSTYGPCLGWSDSVKRRVFEVLGVARWSDYEKHRIAKAFGWDYGVLRAMRPSHPF